MIEPAVSLEAMPRSVPFLMVHTGTGYMDCEYRQYKFSDCSTVEDAHLVDIGVCWEKVDRPAGLDAHVIHETEEVEKTSA